MTEIEVTGLLVELANKGIGGIFISYDGGGDSGQIEHITYTEKMIDDLDTLEEMYNHGIDYNNDLQKLDSSLYVQLENYGYRTLLNNIEDWWNEEGGFGYVVIHIPSGDYRINNSIRVNNIIDHVHEGKLTEKTNG